jgi:starch synthase (maltosyl-transferring)
MANLEKASLDARVASAAASAYPEARRYQIEDVYPNVDGGRYPVKRIAGEPIDVWADIFRDGHDVTEAALLWRSEKERQWCRERMRFHSNDRWTASFTPAQPGRYVYRIEAWTSEYATWRRDLLLKREAGRDIGLEAREGAELLASAPLRRPLDRKAVETALAQFAESGSEEALLDDSVAAVMAHADPGFDLTRSKSFPLIADRPIARAGAWYEMMPRSQAQVPGQHGTFDDCIRRVPEIAELGFDVIYLPPVHPIGTTNRKGKNNALRAGPDDPGSPYAIGSEDGGHDAVHPQLGTLQDFRRFVAVCHEHNMEVALDFAIQCSPDHPWVREKPQWFRRRPDGSIRYAENPPKKYEDIVNPDFYCEDAKALWAALRDVVLFWVEQGVKIFRVDNPHTKPFAFWEWMIREVQTVDRDVIFLAEAFTRPKVMKALAKLGFNQSYTYFTWRTDKAELQEYLTELTRYPEREYYRPNFFVNTPDILPIHLQTGEPRIFKARVALAATLSGNYGIYNGFELIEHEPIPGKEEYLNSEKYEIKVRDWDKPGNIKSYIGRLNRIRHENSALRQTANLRFAAIEDDDIIGFVKQSPALDSAIAVAISLARPEPRNFWFHLGGLDLGPMDAPRPIRAIENLVTGETHTLEWGGVRLWIDPNQNPALLFRCLT